MTKTRKALRQEDGREGSRQFRPMGPRPMRVAVAGKRPSSSALARPSRPRPSKRAASRRAQEVGRRDAGGCRQAGTPPWPPASSGLAVSPLAVPFPVIPPIPGVEIRTPAAPASTSTSARTSLLMRFAEGTSAAGVFTRHGVGSAPVDWCKRQLAASGGADVRAPVVNAGCANSFTGKPRRRRGAPRGHGRRQAPGLAASATR
ncbi:bifunctional ornithine acetyltransferase/N-acetylglutamate synthase [Caulobacter segnis]